VDIDASSLIAGLFVSSVGIVLLSYGKKMSRPPQMVGGLLLVVFPYFSCRGAADARDRGAAVRADLGGGAAGVLRVRRARPRIHKPDTRTPLYSANAAQDSGSRREEAMTYPKPGDTSGAFAWLLIVMRSDEGSPATETSGSHAAWHDAASGERRRAQKVLRRTASLARAAPRSPTA
jgi:hypothetical protein